MLSVIGDHRVVRQTDLRRLLGRDGEPRSESAARLWLDRMSRAGLIHRARAGGATWVQLTAAGGQQVEIPSDPRRLSTWKADHASTVLRLRLLLEARHPEATWEAERYWRLRRKALQERVGKQASLHVPDGSLHWPDDNPVVAVEVELSRKHREDYPAIVRAYPDVAEAWWFCPPELAAWLEDALAKALEPRHGLMGAEENPALSRPHRVVELPPGVRP